MSTNANVSDNNTYSPENVSDSDTYSPESSANNGENISNVPDPFGKYQASSRCRAYMYSQQRS
eukprot:9106417-Pyramimonas_sp.AAC.1